MCIYNNHCIIKCVLKYIYEYDIINVKTKSIEITRKQTCKL